MKDGDSDPCSLGALGSFLLQLAAPSGMLHCTSVRNLSSIPGVAVLG